MTSQSLLPQGEVKLLALDELYCSECLPYSNAQEVSAADIKNYRFYIECGISCFERSLGIGWNDAKVSKDQMQRIVNDAYDRWVYVEENPEVEIWCCEEYILHEIHQLDIEFVYCFLDESEEA